MNTGTERRCPKCRRDLGRSAFKHTDPDGWCTHCRRTDDTRLGKQRCRKCERLKNRNQFKRDDPSGWCNSCRHFRAPAAEPVYEPGPDDIAVSSDVELDVGNSRVVVVSRIGDCVRITTARRIKREVTSCSVQGGTILFPLNHLDELRAALTQVARLERKPHGVGMA